MRKVIKINAMSYAILVKLLFEGTRSCAELAEATGLHVLTVYQYTRELHKVGACHIALWEKDPRGRDCTRIYMLGAGRDAKRRKVSGAERQARWRAKRAALAMNQMMAA